MQTGFHYVKIILPLSVPRILEEMVIKTGALNHFVK